ncbi:MAG: HEAT repeat domain-containing protein [Planctomycetota bacterium]|nr:HEAT repeat domain-containing protein [Planctomycetota bacterium]
MFKRHYLAVVAAFLAALASTLSASRLPAAEDNKSSAEEKQSKLIAVLKSDAPPQDKAMTCKQLAVYGSQEAVPALAPLLSDQGLSSWARIALEAIPDPSADAALREALGKCQGRLLVGVINSIGTRRDAKAVEGLVAKLRDADAEVASAAAVALGRVGDVPAAQALEQSLATAAAEVRSAVAQGCILCAEKLMADGKSASAVKLYDTVRKAEVPKQRLLEATRGAILARQAAGIPLLVEQLKAADKALFGIGLRVARELPGREVTEALVAELGQAAPDRQALLILALADRGDATALPAILATAKRGSSQVEVAALSVLERMGNLSSVPVLLAAAVEGDADVAKTAKAVLADLSGKEVDADLFGRLAKADGKSRLVLIELIGERRIEAALPALIKAAEDTDGQIRAAALAALGATVGLGDLPVLIKKVVQPQNPAETKAADEALTAACIRMPDRDACAQKLVAAMATAPVSAKSSLLKILSAMGGAKALEAVGAAAKEGNPEVQDSASRLLGEWMTADAAPVLLDLAKTAAEAKYKTRALRGYIRIARQLDVPADQRVAMCGEASKICQRDDERKLVLEVLRRNPSAEGLALVVPYLRSAELKAEASSTAVTIAEKVLPKNPAAVADAMQQVLQTGDRDVAKRAQALLDQAARKSSAKK